MCMDTDALRWLQQVADGTTVTEVSELESVTQSGVSRALARLEEQIGTPLLRDQRLAGRRQVRLEEVAGEPFIGLRTASALRRQTDELCRRAGFQPTVIVEGDDLSDVRGFVAAGLGVAVVPAPRAGSPEAVPGPVTYLEILDEGAAREIFLVWSAERRLLPATDLFRRHVLSRAAAGRLPAVSE